MAEIGDISGIDRWRGRWRCYVWTDYKPDGTLERTFRYGKTKAECRAKAVALSDQVRDGIDISDKTTLGNYMQQWLATKSMNVAARTLHNYKKDTARIDQRYMKKRVATLRKRDIQAITKNVKTKAGDRSAFMVHGLLRNALNEAVRDGILPSNPVLLVKAPKYKPKRADVWTASEVESFVTCGSDRRIYPALYLALSMGLRRGEIVGLKWSDLDGGTIHVQRSVNDKGEESHYLQEPKSERSIRTLAVPADAVAVLAKHRERLHKEGKLCDLMFPTRCIAPTGVDEAQAMLMRPENLNRALRRICEELGIRRITVHELRHTYASMMINAGVNAVELAYLLGHHSPAFTMKTYAHLFRKKEQQAKAAPTLADLVAA